MSRTHVLVEPINQRCLDVGKADWFPHDYQHSALPDDFFELLSMYVKDGGRGDRFTLGIITYDAVCSWVKQYCHEHTVYHAIDFLYPNGSLSGREEWPWGMDISPFINRWNSWTVWELFGLGTDPKDGVPWP